MAKEKVVSLPTGSDRPGFEAVAVTRERLQAFLDAHPKYNLANIAPRADMAYPTLNQWWNGTYAGSYPSIAGQIDAFLDREAARVKIVPQLKTVKSLPAYQDVMGGLIQSRDTLGISIIGGEPGVGKTYAAKEYTDKSRRNSLWIDTDYSYRSPLGFFWQVNQELWGKETSMRLIRAKQEFFTHLGKKPKMLVINEADNLNFQTINMLVSAQEKFEIPLAFVGHEELFRIIKTIAVFNRELWRRILTRVEFIQVRPQYGPDHARAFAAQILDDVQDNAIDALCDPLYCRVIRDVVRTCIVARRYQVTEGRAANADLIVLAAAQRTPPIPGSQANRKGR